MWTMRAQWMPSGTSCRKNLTKSSAANIWPKFIWVSGRRIGANAPLFLVRLALGTTPFFFWRLRQTLRAQRRSEMRLGHLLQFPPAALFHKFLGDRIDSG